MTERRRFEHVSIPAHLLDDIIRGDCVLFMGAGASTEGKGTSYWSDLLVDELVGECGYPSTLPKTLPEVAQYYCRTLDANRKGRLVRLIRDRISRFMNIPEAYFTYVHGRRPDRDANTTHISLFLFAWRLQE